MEIISSVSQMREQAESLRKSGKRIGLVPTMGALHEGHLSLIRIARSLTERVITTIFVNPTQFGPDEDFQRYPRVLDSDIPTARENGTDILFTPDVQEMYRSDHMTTISVEALAHPLEGVSRPGHFNGVATVVAKLFNITRPHLAVFGQKDAQQALVIGRMIRDLNFDIEMAIGPIVRENDGLAMSSRNRYLSPEERLDSILLSRALRLAESMARNGERDTAAILRAMESLLDTGTSVRREYCAIVDTETLEPLQELPVRGGALVTLAARVGTTRLIDNTIITHERSRDE